MRVEDVGVEASGKPQASGPPPHLLWASRHKDGDLNGEKRAVTTAAISPRQGHRAR